MSQFQKDFTFTWIIKHFSLYRRVFYAPSPYFNAENIGSEWFIVMYKGSEECISLVLYKVRIGVEALTLDVEIELCNSENETLCVTEKKRGVEFLSGARCTFRKVMLLEELEEKMKGDPEDTLLLRCRMWATGESAGETSSRSCTIETTPCSDELSCMRYVDYSESPCWSTKLNFTMNQGVLNVNIKAHQDDILFEIGQNFDKKSQFYIVKFKISLLEKDKKVKCSSYNVFALSEDNRIWNFPSFLKRSLLEKGTEKLLLKFNFTFSDGCTEFHEIIDEAKHLSLPSSSKVVKNVPTTSSLLGDLRKMLFSREQADVSFRVDSEVISAHKCILASRSPVFSTMFSQEMAESRSGVVDISDMDAKALKLFLEFLYTGELEDSDWERMLELLLAAEKYQVPSLKERCSHFLKHRFSFDTVCDVLAVAVMVGEQALKAAAIDYIKGNVAKVFSSPKWSVFADKNVKLCSEIICNLSEELKIKDIKK